MGMLDAFSIRCFLLSPTSGIRPKIPCTLQDLPPHYNGRYLYRALARRPGACQDHPKKNPLHHCSSGYSRIVVRRSKSQQLYVWPATQHRRITRSLDVRCRCYVAPPSTVIKLVGWVVVIPRFVWCFCMLCCFVLFSVLSRPHFDPGCRDDRRFWSVVCASRLHSHRRCFS